MKKQMNSNNNCNCTFIFDPNGRLCYWMSFVVSLAFIYNFWVIIYRYSFDEINDDNRLFWFALDYLADLLYIMDIVFNFRTGFLEDGVLQTDHVRLRHYYMNTTRFYVDCLCLMPLDILYLSIGYYSILRGFRLVKIYRFWTFLDRTERHTNYPNAFRSLSMLHYLFALFHWNACFVNKMRSHFSPDFNIKILNPKLKANTDITREYLKSFYQSTLIMTLIGVDQYKPQTKSEYLFIILELVVALILFAAIMGNVAYIVANLGNAKKEFQSKLDAVKTYMHIRGVPISLQERVIRWFDYLWSNARSTSDDNQVLGLLPYKLRAEISIHVHLDTLKRVEIFQNTEVGFLNELVLKLKPVLYSPGDYICRKGEVGKEMYIVNTGKLQVISDDGHCVLATLRAGSCFGEISILNMRGSGNRRTASVKSVGYSDLFCLSKEDLWEVLKEYPAVRVKLEAIAAKRLEKHQQPLSDEINSHRRCNSSSLLSLKTNNNTKRIHTLPKSFQFQFIDKKHAITEEPNNINMKNNNNDPELIKLHARIKELEEENSLLKATKLIPNGNTSTTEMSAKEIKFIFNHDDYDEITSTDVDYYTDDLV